MFLSLALPGGDKGVSLMIDDLAGDESFRPHESDSKCLERGRVNAAVNQANRELGDPPANAFTLLFNQFRWVGTTGWEYWSDKYPLMLKHALLVAAKLNVPLHVKMNVLNEVLAAAAESGIKFAYDFASPLQKLNNPDFDRLNVAIASGEYVVLTDVVMS